jgi:protein-tyrosine-phosphatase/predicted ATP-grasp superfamily ATP-dependent carboligase
MTIDKKTANRVLILGDGSNTRSFLSVIRSLGRKNLIVDVAIPSGMTGPSLSSTYVNNVHTLPHYAADHTAWINALEALDALVGFEFIVPIDDLFVIPLQTHRANLSKQFLQKIALLNTKAFDVANSKEKSRQLAESVDVPVSEGAIGHTLEDALAFGGKNEFPIVLKPSSSFSASNLAKKHYIAICYNEDDIKDFFKGGDTQSYVMEAFFGGLGCGIEFLAKDGEVLFVFEHERVHEPLHGGGSSYRRSMLPDKRMVEDTRRIAKELNYTGIGMVEFKRDPHTLKYIFIEINGRFWGSLPLAIAAGADFPYLLYQMHCKDVSHFPQVFNTNTYGRNVLKDLAWFVRNIKADKQDRTLHTKPVLHVLAELRHIILGREHWDTFTLDDPKPFAAEISIIFKKAWRKFIGRPAVIAKQKLPWVRSRKKRLLQRTLIQNGSVMIMCKGNICRSPFATILAGKIWPNANIIQAGTFSTGGRPSPDDAVIVAQQFDIDLSSHKSRVVTKEELTKVDVILAFDGENLQSLRKVYSGAEEKTLLLGSLISSSRCVIDDPYGKGPLAFESCYNDITKAMEVLKVSVQ